MESKILRLLKSYLIKLIIIILAIFAYDFAFAQYRIMPLGDSITRGMGGTPPYTGYRDDLYDLLINDGWDVNLVGSMSDGDSSQFDTDHEGHSGWRAQEIDANINIWLSENTPNLILLHIGTNDIGYSESNSSTIAEIENILDKIFNYNSQTAILLCSLIPRKTDENIVEELNVLIQQLIGQKKINDGYNIYHVDQNAAFKANANWSNDYMVDDVHPNAQGYNVMAITYFDVLKTVTFPEFNLTVIVNPDGAGSVTISPDKATYNQDELVQLRAIPNGNYQFDFWDGVGGDSTINPINIYMIRDRTITANFTGGGEIVYIPNTPNGPANGNVGQSLNFDTGGATSSLGHEVEYQFDWGDGNQSSWGASLMSHSYNNGGTYQVKARARCMTHTNIVSNWSISFSVTISGSSGGLYTLTIVINPAGAGIVEKNLDKVTYDQDELVQLRAIPNGNYQFDFWNGVGGDSTINPINIYMRRDRTITANFTGGGGEIVSIPNTPTGSSNGNVGQSLNFATGGAASSLGHEIEYQFDWGDGNQSSWGASLMSHSYNNGGTYQVKARARCLTHTNIVSNWSISFSVTISGSSGGLYTLTIVINPAGAGTVEKNLDKVTYDQDELVQLRAIPNGNYQFDFWDGVGGDGTINPINIYMIQDRTITANFTGGGGEETVSIPNIPTGSSNGNVGQSLNFATGGATSSLGHEIEYQFDWGDGNQSSWGLPLRSYNYSNSGTFYMRAHARCIIDTNIVSNWSNSHSITISNSSGLYTLTIFVNPADAGTVEINPNKWKYDQDESVNLKAIPNSGYKFDHWNGDISTTSNDPINIYMVKNRTIIANFTNDIVETVSVPNTPTVPSNGGIGDEINFSTGGATSNRGHSVEYQFNWGNGEQSSWGSSSGSYIYNSPGTYNIKARARCTIHTDVVSIWSSTSTIEIGASGLYPLTIVVNPEGAGSVSINPDKSEYSYGEEVQLEAIPTGGNYQFEFWSGDIGTTNSNPINIYMLKKRAIIANFTMDLVETVSLPNIISGPSTGDVDLNLSFNAGGSVSSLGHEVEYQFDWGDGSQSSWGASLRSYIYNDPGTYNIKARARCTTHTNVVSGWSQLHAITISGFSLTISVAPDSAGTVDKYPDKMEYANKDTVTLTLTSIDGFLFSNWSGDLTGNDNPATLIMNSDKSITAVFIENNETVTKTTSLSGPNNGIMGQSLKFSTGGSTSNLEHEVEYQFDWGDGIISGWGTYTKEHVYYSTGSFPVKSRARCKIHTIVVSDWSDVFYVTITGYSLTIAIEPPGAGSVTKNPQKLLYVDSEYVTLSALANSGNKFDSWSEDLASNSNPAIITMNSNKQIIAHFSVTQETVTTPTIFIVPDSGFIEQSLLFTTGGSVDNFGKSVQYQFDWGDSILSDWGDSLRQYIYYAVGVKQIKVRARSEANISIVSDWTESHNIVIYVKYFTISISVNPSGSGSVNRTPFKSEYNNDEPVILSPIPITGYVFHHWSGDLNGIENPAIIYIHENQNITAHFELINEVEENIIEVPDKFAIEQNYPNPFNPETTIRYQLPENCNIKISIFNVQGQLICAFVDEYQTAGHHFKTWYAIDNYGNKVPSGVYIYRMETNYFTETKKMILMK